MGSSVRSHVAVNTSRLVLIAPPATASQRPGGDDEQLDLWVCVRMSVYTHSRSGSKSRSGDHEFPQRQGPWQLFQRLFLFHVRGGRAWSYGKFRRSKLTHLPVQDLSFCKRRPTPKHGRGLSGRRVPFRGLSMASAHFQAGRHLGSSFLLGLHRSRPLGSSYGSARLPLMASIDNLREGETKNEHNHDQEGQPSTPQGLGQLGSRSCSVEAAHP